MAARARSKLRATMQDIDLDTTKAQKKLRAVATALGLCSDCEQHITATDSAYSLATDVSVSEPQLSNASLPSDTPPPSPIVPELPVNDVTWLRSKLNGVRTVDSDLQALIIKDCDLEDVTFRSCRFSNVIFQHLTLKNVTFFNVDFRNVRLREIDLTDVVWSSEGLANALLTRWDFRQTVFGRHVLTLRTSDGKSLTKTLSTPRKVPPELVDEASTFGMRSLGIARREIDLFQLPEKVLAVIVGEIFPRPGKRDERRVVMVDRPLLSLGKSTGQTTYTIKTPFGYQNPPCTYRESLHSSSLPDKDDYDDDEPSERHPITCILLASKRCWKYSIRALYERIFHFNSPEACLAFLHDHQMPADTPVGISLSFTSQTNPAAWKRLFDVLVSDRSDIPEIRLEISAEFWTTTHWMSQASPRQVVESCYMTAWPFAGRTFLQHVMRVPGYRLSGYGRTPATKTEQVRLKIRVDKMEGYPSREAFVSELQMFMRREMMRNSSPGERVMKWDCCETRKLEECCYWKKGENEH